MFKGKNKGKVNRTSKISLESIMPEDAVSTGNIDLLNDKKAKQAEKSKLGIIGIMSAVFFIAGSASYYMYSSKTAQVRQQASYVTEIKRLSEQVEKNAHLAQGAKKEAFEELESAKKSIDLIITVLDQGGKVSDLDSTIAALDSENASEFAKIKSSWESNKPLMNNLISQGKNLTELRSLVEKAIENSQKSIDASFALKKSVSNLQNPKYNFIIDEIILSINRLSGINTDLFSGENFTLTKGYALIKDIKSVSYYLSILKTGSEVYDIPPVVDSSTLQRVIALESAFSSYSAISGKIAENVAVLNSAKELAKIIAKDAARINSEISNLNTTFKQQLDKYFYYQLISGIFFALLAASIAALSVIFYQERNKALKYAGQLKKNQANEAAVDNLLKQMMPIEQGDLTQPISVGDKFVEPIAQRVDTVRSTLKSLISHIKTASNILHKEANDANKIATDVINGSTAQMQTMDTSIQAIGKITSEMDEVAQNTWITKEEAIRSEQISKDGLNTVTAAVQKMNSIRDTIQESAKKIKRLGESAQSIVTVTDLIRNITKEINVLALNAAIQATNSGEGGKAFSIMAQEVQRLAESSAEASKQIDMLIKDIQQDTAVAVASMEQTTSQVVDGTRLNDEAGRILEDISKTSEQIARNMSGVAEAIEKKSAEMVDVSLKVREMQNSNTTSSEKVAFSVQKVEAIAKDAADLAKFVDKYKV